jgi:hypothetical protein
MGKCLNLQPFPQSLWGGGMSSKEKWLLYLSTEKIKSNPNIKDSQCRCPSIKTSHNTNYGNILAFKNLYSPLSLAPSRLSVKCKFYKNVGKALIILALPGNN